jgi:hypothetical protein
VTLRSIGLFPRYKKSGSPPAAVFDGSHGAL